MTGIIEGKILPVSDGREPDPNDPPVFLLTAAPTWAPWLPDGAYQRVPVGASGQVLTVQPDGSVNWANSASGFANPMTTAGDLIDGGAGGAPQRLAIGASGQVLTVVGGAPAWSTAGGFTNPMTTAQDMIVGGAAGVAGRLGVGANGQVLTVTGGAVGWANNAAGFVNPMTTLGDVITGAAGGTAQRLGVGANGQVLTVAGGVPAWANSPSGFANPMTTQGDMITGGLVGAATRLPVGASGQVLTVVSGAPAWASGQSAASAVVFPSGDTSGVKDQAAIMAANNGLSSGGEILLANGQFYVKPTVSSTPNALPLSVQTATYAGSPSTAGLPVSMRGLGAATVIYPVGTGITGIYYHRSTGYGAQYGLPAQPTTGYLRDMVIDGTFALGASTGLDIGDGWGYDCDLRIVNFTGTGAIGFVMSQQVFWCEKGDYRIELINNSQAALLSTAVPTHDFSNEYNRYWFSIFCNANQQGVVSDGTNQGGSEIWLRGNMSLSNGSGAAPPNNIAALSVINAAGVSSVSGHRWYKGGIWMKVEGNPGNGTGTTYPYGFYSDGTGYVRGCLGRISHSLTPGQVNNAEFSFRGLIDDPVLGQLTTGPAGSGQTYANQPVTVTASSPNLLLATGPAWAAGTAVTLAPGQPGSTAPAGFTYYTPYYVVNPSGNNIQLSATPGGAAITPTTAGTGPQQAFPSAPPMPASGALQQNYGPDAQVFLFGGTVTSVILQGNAVGASNGPFTIPGGGAIIVNYSAAPTWLWAPCIQAQY